MNTESSSSTFLDESLDRLMRNDPSLTILNWNHVGIGNGKYCHLLAMALRHNTHLIVLFLNNNNLSGHSRAFLQLCTSIGNHPTLTYLYMSYNGTSFGDVGAIVLAQHALAQQQQSSCRLRVLKLAHNDIGPIGAKALADALKLQQSSPQPCDKMPTTYYGSSSSSSCGLQSLVLEHNRLGACGMLEMAYAMRYNTGLVSLNVRHNQVADDNDDMMTLVQTAFLDSLRHDNCTLSELILLPVLLNDNEESSSKVLVIQELQYYVDWNRLGRQFFGNATIPATAWTYVLAAASTRKSSSSLSGKQQQQHHQQKQNTQHVQNAPPPLPPQSLLFTTLRSRPDLLQQQEQPHS